MGLNWIPICFSTNISSLTGLNWVSTFFSSKMLFAQHYTLRHPTFNICLPTSAIRHPPSTIHYPPSTIRHPPSNIRHPPSTIRHPTFNIRHPPFLPFFSKNTKMQACSSNNIRIRYHVSNYRLHQGSPSDKKTSLNFRAGWFITVIFPDIKHSNHP